MSEQRSNDKTREQACLHACEGLDTADLIGNEKGWLADVALKAAQVESDLNAALRACCPGNGDDPDPVRCQAYEASEQSERCRPGCCVLAEPKDVREVLAAIEREDDAATSSSAGAVGQDDTPRKVLAAMLSDMGAAEWGSDRHGAEMFIEFINRWCPQVRLALSPAQSASTALPEAVALLREALPLTIIDHPKAIDLERRIVAYLKEVDRAALGVSGTAAKG